MDEVDKPRVVAHWIEEGKHLEELYDVCLP
jgi:hypothetical protein